MAVDTRNKRASVIGLGIALVLPLADGSVDAPDRLQVSHFYAGIAAAAPIATPDTCLSVSSTVTDTIGALSTVTDTIGALSTVTDSVGVSSPITNIEI